MTLTELSYYFRKFLPYFVLFSLIFLIFFYSIKLTLIYLKSNQESVVETNLIFGKISPPEIPQSITSVGFKFTLDTIEGAPVTATETAKIFFLPKFNPRFGYSEKIYLIARSFGFDTTVVKHQLNDKIASFIDNKKTLKIDVSNFNFEFDRKIDDALLTNLELNIPSEIEIQNKAIDFLKKIGRYPDELAKGSTKVTYLKYNIGNANFINVERPDMAQLVEVDFQRPDIDNFDAVTPRFFTSQNYVIMLFEGKDYTIIKSQVAFFEKSDDQVGIYPIKTGDQAWAELNNGHGMVVAGTKDQKNIVIKSMKLGYLDPDIYQNYLQPVYVFLGEENFAAYVPAVKE